jgi:hypothetical protein
VAWSSRQQHMSVPVFMFSALFFYSYTVVPRHDCSYFHQRWKFCKLNAQYIIWYSLSAKNSSFPYSFYPLWLELANCTGTHSSCSAKNCTATWNKPYGQLSHCNKNYLIWNKMLLLFQAYDFLICINTYTSISLFFC